MRALDLITVVVPPALPATLSIGTSFSLGRLRKLGIFCISPSRVNVGGKVNVCCFDKTGTLTEDGLDILGVRSLDRGGQMFGELLDDIDDMPLAKDKANFLHAMTTCHSLKMVDGEAIGDPLDMKMFSFTNWTLEEGSIETSRWPRSEPALCTCWLHLATYFCHHAHLDVDVCSMYTNLLIDTIPVWETASMLIRPHLTMTKMIDDF